MHKAWELNGQALLESRHWTHDHSLAFFVPGGSPDGGTGASWDHPLSTLTQHSVAFCHTRAGTFAVTIPLTRVLKLSSLSDWLLLHTGLPHPPP